MTKKRVQPGVPAGGQFAAQAHDEVDVDLGAPWPSFQIDDIDAFNDRVARFRTELESEIAAEDFDREVMRSAHRRAELRLQGLLNEFDSSTEHGGPADASEMLASTMDAVRDLLNQVPSIKPTDRIPEAVDRSQFRTQLAVEISERVRSVAPTTGTIDFRMSDPGPETGPEPRLELMLITDENDDDLPVRERKKVEAIIAAADEWIQMIGRNAEGPLDPGHVACLDTTDATWFFSSTDRAIRPPTSRP